MATRVVTVNDILDGHVGLDLECFDRIYLNGWVHNLQVSGQVVNFLTRHLGFPIPSPAILEKVGLRFRKAVTEYAAAHDIEVIRFAKGERKLEVMRPHLDRLVREGRCGVAAIGGGPGVNRPGFVRGRSGCRQTAPHQPREVLVIQDQSGRVVTRPRPTSPVSTSCADPLGPLSATRIERSRLHGPW